MMTNIVHVIKTILTLLLISFISIISVIIVITSDIPNTLQFARNVNRQIWCMVVDSVSCMRYITRAAKELDSLKSTHSNTFILRLPQTIHKLQE